MDYNEYDEHGNKIIRTTEIHRVNTSNDDRRYGMDETDRTVKKSGFGIGAVIAIVLLAIAAYFLLNHKDDSPRSVTNRGESVISNGYDKTKDALKEVPQAAKDATSKGDQDTTRPNKDDSKDKLDQK